MRWAEWRPVHIQPHHILSIIGEAGCSVAKGKSSLNQVAVRVRYCVHIGMVATVWSLPAVDAKVIDVAGAEVAIHNVPGEGDVGAVLVSSEVADDFLGIWVEEWLNLKALCNLSYIIYMPKPCLTCGCSTQQESCCHSGQQERKECHLLQRQNIFLL